MQAHQHYSVLRLVRKSITVKKKSTIQFYVNSNVRPFSYVLKQRLPMPVPIFTNIYVIYIIFIYMLPYNKNKSVVKHEFIKSNNLINFYLTQGYIKNTGIFGITSSVNCNTLWPSVCLIINNFIHFYELIIKW